MVSTQSFLFLNILAAPDCTCNPYSAWSTKDLIASLKSLKSSVAYFRRQIEYFKKESTCIEYGNSYCEVVIMDYNSIIPSCSDDIIKIQQVLSAREESCMQQTVDYFENLSLVAGGGGVGKSHLVAMSLKQELPSLRISTPCAVASPLAMKVYGVTSSHLLLSPETYTEMMMQSVNPADLSYLTAGHQRKSPISSTTTWSAQQAHSDIDLHLLSLTTSKGVDSLHGKVLGRIVDIGGQPQLLELLPRFTSEISFGVVVTDLSQDLADYPITYFYGEDGKPVGEGIKSNLTNEQIIRVFMQMIMSQTTKLKKIKIMIVGTHKDVEHKSKETRRQKEAKIQEIVTTFGLNNNILYTDKTHSKIIFAVNALHPEKEDYIVGQKIMEETMEKRHAKLISIPIKHHNLELTLKELSKSKKVAIPIKDVLHHVRRYYRDFYDLKEGLQVLHRSFRIFYFQEFPDLVFGEPQLLLNFMTKVTVHHIKLTTSQNLTGTSTGSWKKFTEQGIITEDVLVSISDVFDETLTPAVMVEVMEKLQIVCKIGDGEYLMPSLLTALATLPRSKPSALLRWLPFGLGNYLSDLISGLNSDVTMLFHFSCGLVKFGVYCSTICELITSYSWKLAGPISRNRFYFTRPHCAGTVALIDSFDSFIIINLDVPSSISSKTLMRMCSNVRNTLLSAINKVTKELGYSEDQPVIAFICKHHHSTPHAAEYIKIDEHLLCTKDSGVINQVQSRNRLWLEGLPHEHCTANSVDLPNRASTGNFHNMFSLSEPVEVQKHTSPIGTKSSITLYEHIVDKVPVEKHIKLQQDITSEQHLRRLAEKLTGWEKRCDLFHLDRHCVYCIKHGPNGNSPVLQQKEVLYKWKDKCSPDATYGCLLQVLIEGEFGDCVREMLTILCED